MSTFAVDARYDAQLPVGASGIDAIVRITASGIGAPGIVVSLRLWTPLGATVAILRERSPATADLHGATRLDDRTVEYPAGRWTEGRREYGLAVALPARGAGDEMLAARLYVVVDGTVVARAPIAVTWIDDELRTDPYTTGAARSDRPQQTEELPTGPSPQPRHVLVDEARAEPCGGCGLLPADGDRFCERCGHELGMPAGRRR